MATNVTWRRAPLLAALAAAVVAVGGASAASRASEAAPKPAPASAAQWQKIIAAAKREGSVTVYHTHNPTNMDNAAAKFKEKYGITVTVNRGTDATLAQHITAEYGTGNVKADIWIQASKNYVLGGLKNGWGVQARGPSFFSKRYDRTKYAKPGKAWVVGGLVSGIAWNTSLSPRTVRDYPDLLHPSLANGRIGVIDPLFPAGVDFYKWLEATYGNNYLRRLAAQKPRIYVSSLPMQQAVASGEITAAAFGGAGILDLKERGAPASFAIPPKGAWNTPWWGMILSKAPHPNAAQLFADFLVTPEGQGALNFRYLTVLKNVPGAFNVPLRNQKLSELTPAKVKEYQQYWNSLFRG